MCIDNPAHRSYPGCYTISVPPNPGRDETDLIMDTVQGLSDAADIYQDYRNKMAFCTAITFLHVCIFLDSVPGICRFITMLKKAAIPSIIFIFFFAFIDVGRGAANSGGADRGGRGRGGGDPFGLTIPYDPHPPPITFVYSLMEITH